MSEFSESVRLRALLACKRHCCLCGKHCHTHMELHHIVPAAKGGPGTFENCIPLCFDCHAAVGHYNPAHPKGTCYAPAELRARRDALYASMKNATGKPLENPNAPLGERDLALLRLIADKLPSTASRFLFKDHNYYDSIRYEYVRPMSNLLRAWDKDLHRFENEALAARHATFHAAIDRFEDLAMHFLTLEDGDVLRLWHDEKPVWGDEDYPRFCEMAEDLNRQGTLVWTAYTALFEGTPVLP